MYLREIPEGALDADLQALSVSVPCLLQNVPPLKVWAQDPQQLKTEIAGKKKLDTKFWG